MGSRHEAQGICGLIGRRRHRLRRCRVHPAIGVVVSVVVVLIRLRCRHRRLHRRRRRIAP